MQTWLWLAFFASFAVKMPMWPVHTWLPDAHVEAPTAGSVILAGILLKMGGYGFLRFSLPMFPARQRNVRAAGLRLSIVAIIYTSLVALAQEDMKKLIAYSSVAHMGFVTMGIFTLTHQGVEGGIFQMLSHGVVSGALFLCVGVVYDRMHTREIAAYGGLVNRMPIYAACFMVFTLANVGLPGTGGFVGEFLTMLGAFAAQQLDRDLRRHRRDPVGGLCAVPLSPHHLRRAGQAGAADHRGSRRRARFAILAPLVVITIALGVYPKPVFDVTTPAVAKLVTDNKAALAHGSCRRKLARERVKGAGTVNLQADLLVLLPELILAVGAMVLLLAGAIVRRQEPRRLISWGAIAAAGRRRRCRRHGLPDHAIGLPRRLRRRRLLALRQAPDPGRRGALHPAGGGVLRHRSALSRFELPVLMLLATLGMMLMVSAASFLVALYGAGAADAWRSMCWPPSTATICAPPKRA